MAQPNPDRELVVEKIRELTRHKYAKLVSRGNSAIMCALYIAKKINPKSFLLVPDQGGWISFQTYPKILGFEIRTVKTNRGVIDLIDLEKKADSGAALLVTSFAGYAAEQPLKYISNICRKHGCLLIEDASGAIGDDELCNGAHSDIIVGSFGEWKPVDNGYGGFISVVKKQYFEEAASIFSMTNFYPEYKNLLAKLRGVKQKLQKYYDLQEKVKKDAEDRGFKVIHPKLRGINVLLKPMKETEKENMINFCDELGYEHTECPRYIRLEEEAISVELKRIKFDQKEKK